MSPAESPFLGEAANWARPFPLESVNSKCFMACLRVLRGHGRTQASLSPQTQDAKGSHYRAGTCEHVRRERGALGPRLNQHEQPDCVERGAKQ